MTSLLESRVTTLLTNSLGRAPTASEVSQGLLAPWTLSTVHNQLNVGQSIYSITTTDSIQAALDSAHAQGGGTVYLQPGTYHLTTNLTGYSSVALTGVSPDSTILDFGGTAYGVVFNNISDATLAGFAVQNTTGKGISITNSTKVSFDNIEALGCGIGFFLDTNTEVFASKVLATGCTTDGFQISGMSLCNWQSANAIGNGGNGFTFNTVDTFAAFPMAANNNGGIGVSLTSVTNSPMLIGAISNTSDGIKMVSGCSGMNLFMGGYITNGGYGINIANASDASNIIMGNILNGNTSGAVNNTGTGTLIRSNIGVADN